MFELSAAGSVWRPRRFSGKRICLPIQEMRETWVQSPGWEDPLEEEMAALSSIFARRIPWIEKPGGLQFMGCKESSTLSTHSLLHDYQLYRVVFLPGSPFLPRLDYHHRKQPSFIYIKVHGKSSLAISSKVNFLILLVPFR